MAEKTMNSVRKKLSEVRKTCLGMSEEVYAMIDYMSEIANDELVPTGLAMCLAMAMYDIEQGKNSMNGTELPEYLLSHKEQVLRQAVYVPQVIDEIADADFADEFRNLCKQVFNFDPPKRVNANLEGDYPEHIKVAVDWWANALASPKYDAALPPNPKMEGAFIMAANSGAMHSEEEILVFKTTLAEGIKKELEEQYRCDVSVDYRPNDLLSLAGEKLGLDSLLGYPWRTFMEITESRITVNGDVIWSKSSMEN